jgi:aspartokinase
MLIIQKYGGKALAAPENVWQVAHLIHHRFKSDTADRYLDMTSAAHSSSRFVTRPEFDLPSIE